MTTYTLYIDFTDDSDLDRFWVAKQRLTIVKTRNGEGSCLAWLSFAPQLRNTVTWTEEYSVYASTQAILPGQTIETIATKPASVNTSYTLLQSNHFDNGSPDPIVGPNSYGIFNRADQLYTQLPGMPDPVQMVTAGLLQGAVVNGASTSGALTAEYVLYNQAAVFTPVEQVMVMMSHCDNNGMVMSRVEGVPLQLDLTTNTTQRITFNANDNTFDVS